MTHAAWIMLMLNALFLDYFNWNKEIEEKTYFRDSTVEAISNTDSLRVVHCHQNNDPTLPMQMMVALKLNSKIAPPDGFELINEPNVWLRQGYYQVFEFYSDFWEYFLPKSPSRIFNPEDLGRKIVNEKLVLFTDILFDGTYKSLYCEYDVNSEISSFKPLIDSESSNQILALRQRPLGRLDFAIKLEDSNPKLGSRTIFSISPSFSGSLIYYRIDIETIISLDFKFNR